MRITEAIIVLLYLLFMIGIGLYFYKRARSSSSDYYTAGSNINTFVGAFAIAAAVASSSSLMGAVGSGVTLGLPYSLHMHSGRSAFCLLRCSSFQVR